MNAGDDNDHYNAPPGENGQEDVPPALSPEAGKASAESGAGGKIAVKRRKRSKKGVLITGVAAVILVVLLAVVGVFVYNALQPAIWTEQLPYMNSTGQYQSITIYRNATDVPYGNISAFVSAEKPAVESSISADRAERPVEYAVRIHDDAERQGINCSLVATEVAGGYPGHVLVAFDTKDLGMVYVDPTAKNVSAADYPGIVFGNIQLLRDMWVNDTGVLDGNDKEVYVTEYRNAMPVTYDALLRFLAGDHTENGTYTDPAYTCADFAADLFDHAEAQGIKAGIVSVYFEGQDVGHAFNAFPTTDRGIVYVDDTGLSADQKESYMADYQTDAVVYLQEGEPLGELNISQVGGDLDYSFYAAKIQEIKDFYTQFYDYESDVATHNSAIARYNTEVQNYEGALDAYNEQMNAYNAAVAQFNADNANEYALYQQRKISYQEYSDWYDANTAKVPTAPANGGQISSWKATLDSECTQLNGEKQSLDQRYDALMDSDGFKWAVYSYWQSPDGVVNQVNYAW